MAPGLKAGLVRGTGESEEAGRWFKDPEDVCFSNDKAEVTGVWKELVWGSGLKTAGSKPEVTFGPSPRTRSRFGFLADAKPFEVSVKTERPGTEEAERSLDRFPILRLISERVVSSLSISDKGEVGA